MCEKADLPMNELGKRESGRRRVALGHSVGNQLASEQVKALGFYPAAGYDGFASELLEETPGYHPV